MYFVKGIGGNSWTTSKRLFRFANSLPASRLLVAAGVWAKVRFTRLEKREKVKLLSRWCKTFPELLTSARDQQSVPVVALDAAADQSLAQLETDEYYLLPDDASGMPSYHCVSAHVPNLADLVSDVGTKCDEIVLVDAGFQRSAVLVNHGSPQLTGRHFLR